MKNQKNPIRLTNKTAKNLRRQAIVQKRVLYAAAVILSIALLGAGAWFGLQHIVVLPLMMLLAIGMDLLLVLFARGRYLSLVGQAICTEAAARQMKRQSAEDARVETARLDLERIKQDLKQDTNQDPEQEDEYEPYDPYATYSSELDAFAHTEADEDEDEDKDDEDVFAPLPQKRPTPRMEEMPMELIDTRANAPVRLYSEEPALEETAAQAAAPRRRRQARLQVLMSDTPDNRAN